MKKATPLNFPKRNHKVVVPNFFGAGENLEAWQLGWQPDYVDGEILYMIPCDESVWDNVKFDGKSLEEVLQNSYIINIS